MNSNKITTFSLCGDEHYVSVDMLRYLRPHIILFGDNVKIQ